MNKRILLTGVVGLSLSGLAIPSVRGQGRAAEQRAVDKIEDRIDHDRDLEDVGRRMKFDELPGEVKSTVGKEAGMDRVSDVRQFHRGGRTLYRVDIEGKNTSHVVYVDENGSLLRDMNDTTEGRRHVRFNDLPGEVKNTLGKITDGKNYDRITQITRNDRTWYLGEYTGEGGQRWVRVDGNGQLMGQPRLLSDVPAYDGRRDRDRDDYARNHGGYDIVRVEAGDLPREVRDTIRREEGRRQISKINALTKEGRTHYVVDMNDGTVLKIGGDGRLLDKDFGPQFERNDVRGISDDRRARDHGGYDIRAVEFGDLPGDVKDTIRRERNGHEIRRINALTRDGRTHYVVELTNGHTLKIGGDGKLMDKD